MEDFFVGTCISFLIAVAAFLALGTSYDEDQSEMSKSDDSSELASTFTNYQNAVSFVLFISGVYFCISLTLFMSAGVRGLMVW